jgi:hypothetical protein
MTMRNDIVAKKVIPFLRSPVWITTGFGAKYAGPNGTNFKCKSQMDFFAGPTK